jgi:hypothetical protein
MTNSTICRYALMLIATALLTGCGGSQPPIGAPEATLQLAAMRAAGPLDAPITGIYVSQGSSSDTQLFGYPSNNRKNKGPICTENVHPTYDLAVDGKGNLIAPNTDDTVTVFAGPRMCGRSLGTFKTVFYPVDASSSNAASGKIAVGIAEDGGSGNGVIQVCTLKKGCYATLSDGTQIDFLVAVAMNKHGDCWASGILPTTLIYFKGCSAAAQSTTGYENTDAGGLDIDNEGHLLSISCSEVSCSTPELYVYSGCNPRCKKVGGPFALHGTSWYGHLNANNTRFATADYEYGQVDVYKYAPTSVTYLYSFDSGLSTDIRGVAYSPGSGE